MTVGARLVEFPSADTAPARCLVNGVDKVVVYAETDADAIAMAKSLYGGDTDALWDNATVTLIAAASNLIGFTARIRVWHPTTGAVVADVSQAFAGAPTDTIDEVAALLVTALNATAINGAAYNSGTQVLTIAETTDNKGDHRVLVEFYETAAANPVAIPGFIASGPTHLGASGDALSVTLCADAYKPPKFYAAAKSA